MPATRTISCQDCGHEYETIRKNTLRCSVCSLAKGVASVAAAGNRPAFCLLCDAKFLPLGRDDRLCAGCAPASSRPGHGDCAFCGQDKPFCRVGVAVCLTCAQDPSNRKRLYAALVRKINQRQEAAV